MYATEQAKHAEPMASVLGSHVMRRAWCARHAFHTACVARQSFFALCMAHGMCCPAVRAVHLFSNFEFTSLCYGAFFVVLHPA